MRQKEKNSIIVWFALSVGVLISFLIYTLIYIYPNIKEVEETKANLKIKLDEYKLIEEKWFEFKDFKLLNTKDYSSNSKEDEEIEKLLNDWFYKKIYKWLDENFYNKLVYNWSYETFNYSKNFWKYLNEKIISLNDIIEGKELNDTILKISSILPKYSELVILDTNTWLSDLGFVSYIESLLKKYNLKIDNSIWIKNVLAIENGVIDPDDNVFYIPLELDIVWTKWSILKFLQYIKNTGDIEFSENSLVFLDNPWTLSQLSEVKMLEFKEYIDSSYRERTVSDETLDWFLLKTNQSKDIIEARRFIR